MPKRRAIRPPRTAITIDDVSVIAVHGKGRGVVARVAIPANARLVYTGRTITAAQLARLERRAVRRPAAALTSHIVASGRAGLYIDAHPRLPEHKSDWIAGMVNEPSANRTANMFFTTERRVSHGWLQIHPVFVTVRAVHPGEELTVKYTGPATPRTFRRTYAVGRGARRPTWM